MPSVEDMLTSALGAPEGEKLADAPDGAASPSGGDGEEFDVASFVEGIGKTASDLRKAAEALPTSPALAKQQLKLLDNPLSVRKQDVHEGHKGFVGQVLPQARSSLSIPLGIAGIQKGASAEKPGLSYFRRH